VAGATESFRHAVEADANHSAAHANLGYLYFRDLAEYERGAEHIERALALDPNNRSAQCNYTMVLSHRSLHEEALAVCDRLLAESPGMHEARLNRALVLLKLRRYDEGWDDYESRKQVRCNFIPRTLPWPEWQGEDLNGKTILVHGEQGLGDEIMFASCIEAVISRARQVVIECSPRLRSLFERSFSKAIVRPGVQGASSPAWVEDAPTIDCHSPSGSLPRYFRRRESDFPAHGGYLVADPERLQRWQGRMAALGPGLKVGLSWRGGMQSTRRTLRSLDLSLFDSILRTPGTRFVDLQYGDTLAERSALAARGIDLASWPDAIADFDEAAALICSLDLVITVCTTVVHLTGALGREAWVLVPSVPEWRYQADGASMPWYPTVQLFRQGNDEGWDAVIERTAVRLSERAVP
jgi:tetratricopeptide (TPR) repeat protein